MGWFVATFGCYVVASFLSGVSDWRLRRILPRGIRKVLHFWGFDGPLLEKGWEKGRTFLETFKRIRRERYEAKLHCN